jgi:hypothetical protein
MDRVTRQNLGDRCLSQNPQNTQNTLWLIEATPPLISKLVRALGYAVKIRGNGGKNMPSTCGKEFWRVFGGVSA